MSATYIPPQDLDAEEHVLGAILLCERALEVVAEELEPGDFYRLSHGTIFETALAVHREGVPVDALTLADALDRRGLLAEVGGKIRVHELAALGPPVVNARHYARIVKANARQRVFVRTVGPLVEKARNGGVEKDELLDALEALRGLTPDELEPTGWLDRADALLREPDPGPTPFLVEGLLMDGAIAFIQGPHKVGKTWVVLELALAVVTDRAAFGTFAVPNPGPVIAVLEESGRTALHRRLDRLTRGYALTPEEMAGFHFAANRGVRLNDPAWQGRLLAAGRALQPRAIILDPFARVKGSTVDENVQREVGPVLDFIRELRDATGSAIVLVHHTGHEGLRLRGSSDLEAYWESKIVVGREDGQCQLHAEHREAEETPAFRYRLAFDGATSTVKLTPIYTPETPDPYEQIKENVAAYLGEHTNASANTVYEAVGGRREDVLRAVREIREVETTDPLPLPLAEPPGRFRSPGNHREPDGRAPTPHAVPPDNPPPPKGEGFPGTAAADAGSADPGAPGMRLP